MVCPSCVCDLCVSHPQAQQAAHTTILTRKEEKQDSPLLRMMSFLTTRLLPHRRHLHAATIPVFSTKTSQISSPTLLTTTAKSNFHTSAALLRPGYKPERNPKIGITLQQLRMAARGQGTGLPICHEQQEKVMNSLEAAKYEVCVVFRDTARVLWVKIDYRSKY